MRHNMQATQTGDLKLRGFRIICTSETEGHEQSSNPSFYCKNRGYPEPEPLGLSMGEVLPLNRMADAV